MSGHEIETHLAIYISQSRDMSTTSFGMPLGRLDLPSLTCTWLLPGSREHKSINWAAQVLMLAGGQVVEVKAYGHVATVILTSPYV